jgi:hypothetical protein
LSPSRAGHTEAHYVAIESHWTTGKFEGAQSSPIQRQASAGPAATEGIVQVRPDHTTDVLCIIDRTAVDPAHRNHIRGAVQVEAGQNSFRGDRVEANMRRALAGHRSERSRTGDFRTPVGYGNARSWDGFGRLS